MLYQVTAGAAASFSDLSYDPETLVSGGLLVLMGCMMATGLLGQFLNLLN